MTLIFDTETTGLPTRFDAPYTDTANWPRLVQLAAGLYTDDGVCEQSFSVIVQPNGFNIPANIIHGVSHERAVMQGIESAYVLDLFFAFMRRANLIVCHNYWLDFPIIGAEVVRNLYDNSAKHLSGMPYYCTKEKSTNYCKIPKLTGYYKNSNQYKWPSLKELHMHLFGEGFDGAHNADADMKATARCYFEMKRLGLYRTS